MGWADKRDIISHNNNDNHDVFHIHEIPDKTSKLIYHITTSVKIIIKIIPVIAHYCITQHLERAPKCYLSNERHKRVDLNVSDVS